MQNFTQVNASIACTTDCAIQIASLLTLFAFCVGCNMQILVCGFACCTICSCITWMCNCGYDIVKDDVVDDPIIVTVGS